MGYMGWLATCVQRDAVGMHAYRLAETASDRAAVATDLIVIPVKPSPEAPR